MKFLWLFTWNAFPAWQYRQQLFCKCCRLNRCASTLWISLFAYLPSFLTRKVFQLASKLCQSQDTAQPLFVVLLIVKTVRCWRVFPQSIRAKNLVNWKMRVYKKELYEPVPCNSRRQETLAKASPILLGEDPFHNWQHWTIILRTDIVHDVWNNDEDTILKQILILPVLVLQYLIPVSSCSSQN